MNIYLKTIFHLKNHSPNHQPSVVDYLIFDCLTQFLFMLKLFINRWKDKTCHQQYLDQEILSQLQAGLFCDVQLQCCDGVVLSCHKIVLSRQSSFFRWVSLYIGDHKLWHILLVNIEVECVKAYDRLCNQYLKLGVDLVSLSVTHINLSVCSLPIII